MTIGRVLFGLRPSPFSLSRLLGSSRLSTGLVREAPRTPLLSFASSSEYHRRRLPYLQAGSASSPRVLAPPAHQGTRGPQTRGSQTPIRSPLSVSHALRGLLPPEPSWAYSIPLALLGFHHEDPPASGGFLAEADLTETNPTRYGETLRLPVPSRLAWKTPKSHHTRRRVASREANTSRRVPRAKPSSPAGRERFSRRLQPAL